MAQVLGNLGISLTKDIDRSGEPQAPNSSYSNLVFDLIDMEIPSTGGTKQPEQSFRTTRAPIRYREVVTS
jgi:hypothetical protein